jgi:hypothetical protein
VAAGAAVVDVVDVVVAPEVAVVVVTADFTSVVVVELASLLSDLVARATTPAMSAATSTNAATPSHQWPTAWWPGRWSV